MSTLSTLADQFKVTLSKVPGASSKNLKIKAEQVLVSLPTISKF